MSTEPSLQERFFPTLTCFGCGPANPRGLQLRSTESDDGVVRATFRPWPEHDNGMGFLNGGIIATLLDCHSAAAVMLTAHHLGVPAGPSGGLQYVTAALDVKYRRPSPLTEPVELVARTTEADEDAITANIELRWEGKVRAEAVATWKRWRPRTAPPASAH